MYGSTPSPCHTSDRNFLLCTGINIYSCIDFVSVLAGRSTNLKIQHSDKYLSALDYLKIRKMDYNNIIIIIIIIAGQILFFLELFLD